MQLTTLFSLSFAALTALSLLASAAPAPAPAPNPAPVTLARRNGPLTSIEVATAPDCQIYPGGSTGLCMDSDSIWAFRDAYCRGNDWRNWNSKIFWDGAGHTGQITRVGVFNDQQECWDILQILGDKCPGHGEIATWTEPGLEITWNYCLTLDRLMFD